MEIRTERLFLREFHPADAGAVFAYQSKPAYLLYSPWRKRTVEEVGTFVEMLRAWTEERPRAKYQLAITLDEHLIGTCGVRKETPDGIEAEFGCELDPDYWGRGYAREASRAILAFGFGTLELRRVWARVVPENTRAVRLVENLGLRRKEAGLYVILKEEWAG